MPTSIEKINALVLEFESAPAQEGTDAILQLLALQALPMLRPMLPSDPAELDRLLTTTGDWILSLRSDDASSTPQPSQNAAELATSPEPS